MNSIRIENFVILIFWWFIFMVVLPWDQEKIVALNLILFLYFLYYMVGDTITNTFEQKKEVTLSILNSDLSFKISLLKQLVKENQILLNNYSSFLLFVFNKYLSSLTNQINKSISTIKNNSNFDFNVFSLLLNSFYLIKNSKNILVLQKNIFVSKHILDSSIYFEESLSAASK